MIELFIASDVTSRFMSFSSEDFLSYVNWNENVLFRSNEIEMKLNQESLVEINVDLENKIDALLPILPKDLKSTTSYSTVSYHDEVFKISYRDKRHYDLGMLVGLNNIFKKTMDCKGILYIFNRTAIDVHRNASVISLLKVKQVLSIVEIQSEINRLSVEFDSVEKVEKIEIEKSINFLQSYGFVDNDMLEEDKYKLTAKGYMIII